LYLFIFSDTDKIKMDQLNFNLYSRVPNTPPEVSIFWRMYRFDNEVEFVVRVKTASWVGIGWRPAYLTSSCRRFPTNATDPDPLNGPSIEEVAPTPGYDWAAGGLRAQPPSKYVGHD
jgi:hypothetical protein